MNEISTGELTYIPIELLHPHPDNPRKDVGDVTELAESIKVNGILQNLTVVQGYYRPKADCQQEDGFTVIIGHRRLAAAKAAGLTELPCAIVKLSDKEQISMMLTENMQRTDLTIVEQAHGFQMMLDMGESIQTISEKSGFSETTVRRRVEIAKLDKDKLKKAEKRQLSLGDFEKLSKIEDLEARNALLDVLGTNNFDNKYASALEKQKFEKKKSEWLEVIKTFAEEDPNANYQNKRYIRNYSKWTNASTVVQIPEDADHVKYYYKVCDTEIDIYTDKDDAREAAEAAARKERERIDQERRQAMADIKKRHYELRSEFMAGLSKTDCKKHLIDIVLFLATGLENGDGIDYDDLVDFGIAIDEDKSNFEGIASEPDVISAAEECPERLAAWLAYNSMDNEREGYTWDRWSSDNQRYETVYNENSELDHVYSFLSALGYEMSDEEIAMQNGTHEIFSKKTDG